MTRVAIECPKSSTEKFYGSDNTGNGVNQLPFDVTFDQKIRSIDQKRQFNGLLMNE